VKLVNREKENEDNNRKGKISKRIRKKVLVYVGLQK